MPFDPDQYLASKNTATFTPDATSFAAAPLTLAPPPADSPSTQWWSSSPLASLDARDHYRLTLDNLFAPPPSLAPTKPAPSSHQVPRTPDPASSPAPNQSPTPPKPAPSNQTGDAMDPGLASALAPYDETAAILRAASSPPPTIVGPEGWSEPPAMDTPRPSASSSSPAPSSSPSRTAPSTSSTRPPAPTPPIMPIGWKMPPLSPSPSPNSPETGKVGRNFPLDVAVRPSLPPDAGGSSRLAPPQTTIPRLDPDNGKGRLASGFVSFGQGLAKGFLDLPEAAGNLGIRLGDALDFGLDQKALADARKQQDFASSIQPDHRLNSSSVIPMVTGRDGRQIPLSAFESILSDGPRQTVPLAVGSSRATPPASVSPPNPARFEDNALVQAMEARKAAQRGLQPDNLLPSRGTGEAFRPLRNSMHDIKENVDFGANPKYAHDFSTHLVESVGRSMPAILAGVATGGSETAVLSTNALQMYQQQYDDAIENGASPETAHQAGLMSIPLATFQKVGDLPVARRIIGGLDDTFWKAVGKSAVQGGSAALVQRVGQDSIANDILRYRQDDLKTRITGPLQAGMAGVVAGGGLNAGARLARGEYWLPAYKNATNDLKPQMDRWKARQIGKMIDQLNEIALMIQSIRRKTSEPMNDGNSPNLEGEQSSLIPQADIDTPIPSDYDNTYGNSDTGPDRIPHAGGTPLVREISERRLDSRGISGQSGRFSFRNAYGSGGNAEQGGERLSSHGASLEGAFRKRDGENYQKVHTASQNIAKTVPYLSRYLQGHYLLKLLLGQIETSNHKLASKVADLRAAIPTVPGSRYTKLTHVGKGAEADVYNNKAQKIAYKLFKVENGKIGLRVPGPITRGDDGEIIIGKGPKATLSDFIGRMARTNAQGQLTPAEWVAITPDNYLVYAQPYIEGENVPESDLKEALNAVGLKFITQSGKGTAIGKVNGKWVLFTDFHGKNLKRMPNGEIEVIDALNRELTDHEVENFKKWGVIKNDQPNGEE